MTARQALKTSVAVVTGAAQGLGRGIALRLASDGHSVVLSDLPSKKAALASVRQECADIYKSHPQGSSLAALQLECDVTAEDQVNTLVDTVVKELGGLNVMVANAGAIKIAPLMDVTKQEIDFMHSVNVKGVFYSYRAAARAMIPSGGGKIIGACSIAGKAGVPSFGAYCMTKAAVRSLTHTAAQEWATYGITVNAYAPGVINTDMWTKDVVAASAKEDEGLLEQMATVLTHTKKKSTPEQIAGLVSFLISPAADNITGQCISVDGGWNMD